MYREDELRQKIDKFEFNLPRKNKGLTVSIKIRRTNNGCFCHEHCAPMTYQIIDSYLYAHPSSDFSFEKHEHGPEIIAYIALGAAGINLAASIINLISATIKAHAAGVTNGDRASGPIEIVARGFDKKGVLKEEKVLTVGAGNSINSDIIKKGLQTSVSKMITPSIKKRRPIKKSAVRLNRRSGKRTN